MDARCRGESRCNSGKYRDEDIQDFTPKGLVFHRFPPGVLKSSTPLRDDKKSLVSSL